ncbi:hypothetical protein P4S70_20475 [Enterovibrio sp. Hal110]
MKIIKTKDEHQAALARIEQLWDTIPNTSEGNEIEALITQVQAFEDKHCMLSAVIQFGPR